MATGACSLIGSCGYNGGWDSSYGTQLGYAGSTNKCYIIKFKTPAYDGTVSNKVTSLSGNIKIRRAGNKSGSGTVTFKIFSSDPKGGAFPSFTGGTTLSWNRDGSGWEDHSYAISTTSLAASTTYYLGVGPYSGDTAELSLSDFSATVTYTPVNNVGKGTTTIHDNYNNSFYITATAGSSGTGDNTASLDTSKCNWGYTSSRLSKYTPNTNISLTTSGIGDTRTVYAASTTKGSVGGSNESTTSSGVRQYLGPYPPSELKIKYDKSRLTIKEPWKFTWNPATKVNKYSEVVGYRIRLYKNGNVIPNIKLATNSKTKITTGGTNQYIDTDSTLTYVEFDPTDFEFEAGQTVKLGIYAYTRYGQNNDVSGDPDLILFNGTGTNSTNYDSGTNGYSIAEVFSDDYPILNAGVTRVKVDNKWEEGIVYVKADNKWVEADLVYTKADDKWKESE